MRRKSVSNGFIAVLHYKSTLKWMYLTLSVQLEIQYEFADGYRREANKFKFHARTTSFKALSMLPINSFWISLYVCSPQMGCFEAAAFYREIIFLFSPAFRSSVLIAWVGLCEAHISEKISVEQAGKQTARFDNPDFSFHAASIKARLPLDKRFHSKLWYPGLCGEWKHKRNK